jgi:hypothetical protein
MWQEYLPVLDKAFNRDENKRAREFVLDRHELRKQATRVENQSPEEQAIHLERPVRDFQDEYHDIAECHDT